MTSGLQTITISDGKIHENGGGLLNRYRRLLRVAGVTLWLFLLVATHLRPGPRDVYYHWSNPILWFSAWLLFGVAFWLNTSSAQMAPWLQKALFAAETTVAIYFAWLQPGSSITFLLILVAWHIALVYPPNFALAWIVGQTILHVVINKKLSPNNWMDLTAYLVYFGFKTFSCLIVILAKQEAEARLEQAVVNAQLEATRELLTENSRSLERLRISRELHDALGHRLTALYLHLEIALNGRDSSEIDLHVRKAQDVSKALLADVREVVRELRASTGIDLHGALQALATNLPGLRVHLTAPVHLAIEDSNQAEVLIRCVQELITNAMKHAGATELWIDLKLLEQVVYVTAHDNGRKEKLVHRLGFGLLGMRERFLEYGGLVEVISEENAGFCIKALLPLRTAQVQA